MSSCNSALNSLAMTRRHCGSLLAMVKHVGLMGEIVSVVHNVVEDEKRIFGFGFERKCMGRVRVDGTGVDCVNEIFKEVVGLVGRRDREKETLSG